MTHNLQSGIGIDLHVIGQGLEVIHQRGLNRCAVGGKQDILRERHDQTIPCVVDLRVTAKRLAQVGLLPVQ